MGENEIEEREPSEKEEIEKERLTDTGEKRKRLPFIAVVIGILLFIAGTVFVILYINNPMRKIHKALEIKDIVVVNELFPELKDAEDKRDVQREVLSYCKEQYEAFRNEKISYEEALETFDLAKEKVLTYNDDYLALRSRFDALYKSKLAYSDACAFFAKGDYKSALEEYEKVIAEDIDYDKALLKIEECERLLTPPALGEWVCVSPNWLDDIFQVDIDYTEEITEFKEEYGVDIVKALSDCSTFYISCSSAAMIWNVDINEEKAHELIADMFAEILINQLCKNYNCSEFEIWRKLRSIYIYDKEDLIVVYDSEILKLENELLEFAEMIDEQWGMVLYTDNAIQTGNDTIEIEVVGDEMKWTSWSKDGRCVPMSLVFQRLNAEESE